MKSFISYLIQRISSFSRTNVVSGQMIAGDLVGTSESSDRHDSMVDTVVTERIPFRTAANAMTVAGCFQVEWIRSDAMFVELTTERRLLPFINIHMDGSRLVVTIKEDVSFSSNSPVHVRVQSPSMENLWLQGSGSVRLEKVQQEHLCVHMQGSGDFVVQGHVVDCHIEKTGSGDLHAHDLHTRMLDLQQMGSGDSTVWCNGAIIIHNHGSGDVFIHGHPGTRSITSHGSGEVNIF